MTGLISKLIGSFLFNVQSARSFKGGEFNAAVLLQIAMLIYLDGHSPDYFFAYVEAIAAGFAIPVLLLLMNWPSSGIRRSAWVIPLLQGMGSTGVLVLCVVFLYFDFQLSPYILFFGHLAGCILSVNQAHQARKDIEAEFSQQEESGPDSDIDAIRRMRDQRLEEFGPTIGLVQDSPIPAWVRLSNGQVMQFVGYVGASLSPADIAPDELLIPPGLLYKGEARAA